MTQEKAVWDSEVLLALNAAPHVLPRAIFSGFPCHASRADTSPERVGAADEMSIECCFLFLRYRFAANAPKLCIGQAFAANVLPKDVAQSLV